MLKPEIVFFGDNVPKHTAEKLANLICNSDALLILGSSLLVYSGYRILLHSHDLGTPIAIVNIGSVRGEDKAQLKISTKCGDIIPKLFVSRSWFELKSNWKNEIINGFFTKKKTNCVFYLSTEYLCSNLSILLLLFFCLFLTLLKMKSLAMIVFIQWLVCVGFLFLLLFVWFCFFFVSLFFSILIMYVFQAETPAASKFTLDERQKKYFGLRFRIFVLVSMQ